jgi:hypothetical protein
MNLFGYETIRLYRSVRNDELFELLDNGILAHCNNCPKDPCCKITDRQHVTSGTKSRIKSRYISTTKNESIAAWWSCNVSGNPSEHKSATYIEYEDIFDASKMIDTITRVGEYGATAYNSALASKEVLVIDKIPISKITNIYRIKTITKDLYDRFGDVPFYIGNNIFKTIYSNVQNKPKYMLKWKIWSKIDMIDNYDLVYSNFPDLEYGYSVLNDSKYDKFNNKKIIKAFDGINYKGEVLGKIGKLYYIKYEDGDSENLNEVEIMKYLDDKTMNKSKTMNKPLQRKLKSNKRSRTETKYKSKSKTIKTATNSKTIKSATQKKNSITKLFLLQDCEKKFN